MGPKSIFELLKATYSAWSKDKASRLAAAISYYTIFSIGPLVLIVVSVAALVLGQQAARGEIVGRIEGAVGAQAAQTIQGLLQAAYKPTEGLVSTAIGTVTLLLAAAGLFGQLQDALNTIWGVEAKPGLGIRGIVMPRLTSFLMVIGLGIVLLAASLATAAVSAALNYFGDLVPAARVLLPVADFLVSFAVVTLIFAMVYKVLPDVKIAWRDVWLGSAVTSLLFVIGKIAIGLYLANVSVGSAFGAAGSLVVLLVWIYYSAQIFFFGAEFTQVQADMYGSKVEPSAHAQWIPGAKRAALISGEGQAEGRPAARAGAAGEGVPGREALPERRRSRRRFPSPVYVLLLISGVVSYVAGIFRGDRESRA